jgi:hypothetical protein
MNDARLDTETLAAFLDGKLDPSERTRVLRILADHPEQYEVFADAARAAGALAETPVVPIDAARRRRWAVPVAAAVAAGIAAAVFLPRRNAAVDTPAALATAFEAVTVTGNGSLALRLGANWDQPGWSVTRGVTGIAARMTAFRLGARATDVEIAIKARDSAALRLVGAELVDLVASHEAGAAVAAAYREVVAAGLDGSAEARARAASQVRELLSEGLWFDLGVWAEAARVALAAGQLEFVRDRRSAVRRFRERVLERPTDERGAMPGLLEELESALVDGPREEIQQTLARLIAAAGG